MEHYETGTHQKLWVHDKEDCSGQCPIHNPSDHPLKEAKIHWRDDRGIMERICEHGIGHPDYDNLVYLQSKGIDEGIHGCDGCCFEKPS